MKSRFKIMVQSVMIHSFWINKTTNESVEVVEVHRSTYDDTPSEFSLTYLTWENIREHTTLDKFLDNHTYIPPKKEYTYGNKITKHHLP